MINTNKCNGATTEKSSAVGDASKLRDALIKAQIALKVCDWPEGTDMDGVAKIMREIDDALAAPSRNCDIGTVDEQTERFVDFTRLYFQSEMVRLAMNWAQMPYKEGGAE